VTDYVTFEAAIEPVVWGRAIHTILRLPDEVAAALRAQGAWDRWQSLTTGKQRGMLYQIGIARTAATRDKRIATLVRELTS